MEEAKWLERYTLEFMRSLRVERETAERCIKPVDYADASNGFENDPEGAAWKEMSYWEG